MPNAAVAEHARIQGLVGVIPLSLDAGVTVWVDPTSDRVPHVAFTVLDEDSRPVLTEVLGPVQDTELTAHLDGEPFTPPLAHGAAWDDLHRLGTLLWLEQHATDPFPQWLMDIDIAATAAKVAYLGLDNIAEERFRRSWEHLIQLGYQACAGDLPAEIGRQIIRPAIIEAVTVYVDGIEDAEREAALELAEQLDQLPAPDSQNQPTAGWAVAGTTPLPALRRSDVDLAASVSLEPQSAEHLDWRRDSVDWLLVPQNILSSEEDSVHWTAADDVVTLHVEAAPPRDPQLVSHYLRFAITDASGAVQTAGSLDYDPEHNRYIGQGWLQPDTDVTGSVADVYSAQTRRRPLTGPARSRARLERNIARAFLRARSLPLMLAPQRAQAAKSLADDLSKIAREFDQIAATTAAVGDEAERAALCRAQAKRLRVFPASAEDLEVAYRALTLVEHARGAAR